MKYKKIKNLMISRFTLGTVQLGLSYGIANKNGKPTENISSQILDLAIQYGINTFDTSPVYGESEKIIGSFISSLKTKSSLDIPYVITKIPPVAWRNKTDSTEIYKNMRNSVVESIKTLNLQQIPICLLHSANAGDLSGNGGIVIKSLLRLKEEGLINIAGASVYSSNDVQEFLKTESLEAIEIPINMFDQSLIKTKLIYELKRRDIITFARSVFLQGLFFLPLDNLPAKLQPATPFLRDLKALSQECDIKISQLAIAYVRDLEGITSLVLGLETVEQLQENLNLINSPPLSNQIRHRISKLFYDVPEDITNPTKWKH